jgi:hypothetical protein
MRTRASVGRPLLILGLIWLAPVLGYEFNVGPTRYDPKLTQSLSQKTATRQALWTSSASSHNKSNKAAPLWTMGSPIREPMRMMPQQTPMVPYMVRLSYLNVDC